MCVHVLRWLFLFRKTKSNNKHNNNKEVGAVQIASD